MGQTSAPPLQITDVVRKGVELAENKNKRVDGYYHAQTSLVSDATISLLYGALKRPVIHAVVKRLCKSRLDGKFHLLLHKTFATNLGDVMLSYVM